MIRQCVRCRQSFTITSSRNIYCPACRSFICIVCKRTFIKSPRDGAMTCTSCRGKARLAPTLICGFCHKPFPQRGGHRTKYCKPACRYAASRKHSATPNHRTWQYKRWRRQVFKRDDYVCQQCGAVTQVQPHHIKSMSKHPELAYILSNGTTLCSPCHTTVHGGKPTNAKGTDRLACAICGDAITGTGKTPYCRSCAMRRSAKAKAHRKTLTRNTEGQFSPPPNAE